MRVKTVGGVPSQALTHAHLTATGHSVSRGLVNKVFLEMQTDGSIDKLTPQQHLAVRRVRYQDTRPQARHIRETVLQMIDRGETVITRGTVDAAWRKKKKGKISTTTIDRVLHRMRAQGILGPHSREAHSQVMKDAASTRSSQKKLILEAAETLVAETGKGNVSTADVFEHLHVQGHTHIRRDHTGKVLRPLIRTGHVRRLTPQEIGEKRRKAAAAKGAQSAIVYDYVMKEVLGKKRPRLAQSAGRITAILHNRGIPIKYKVVEDVLRSLRKRNILRRFTEKERSKLRSEWWRRIPAEQRQQVGEFLNIAAQRGLSGAEHADFLTIFEEISISALKQRPSLFYQRRNVREKELLKHAGQKEFSFIELGGRRNIVFKEPLADKMVEALRIVLGRENKGMERVELVRELQERGYAKIDAYQTIAALVDIGALDELGFQKRSKGKKFVIVHPYWWKGRSRGAE